MVIKEESGLKFGFPDDAQVIKFDETVFYRRSFNAFPTSKGMDFISVTPTVLSFIEIKNCLGDEANCRWRVFPDNQKRETSHSTVDRSGRDSLDIEVSQKVAATLAALLGARSFETRRESVKELEAVQDFLFSSKLMDENNDRYVILFLEGDFASHTRSKKMIMDGLQRSLRTKLRWFNCKVSVVDSSTYCEKIFYLIQ